MDRTTGEDNFTHNGNDAYKMDKTMNSPRGAMKIQAEGKRLADSCGKDSLRSAMRRLAVAFVAPILAMASLACVAQTPEGALPILPGAQGEPWTTATLYEFYAARDRQPNKRERTQSMVCAVPGTFGLTSAAGAELPPEYKDKCWIGDKREEANRQQIKFACGDGMTAEAVTRREPDGSFASKFVINVPGKGSMSMTRTFRKASGICDVTKVSPEVPVPPAKPVAPPKK